MSEIDRKTAALLNETTASMGGEALPPSVDRSSTLVDPQAVIGPEAMSRDPAVERPPTVNPSSAELRYQAAADALDVAQRLEQYSQIPADAMRLTLEDSLAYAMEHSREYRFAEEEYLLAALRLLSERHLWGPRFFDDVTAQVSSFGDGGMYDTALDLVNEFRVTQRLPYGGEISARALALATEDLHGRVAGESVQSAALILDANLPLLRGAGQVAREDLIQSERNLVYAARGFEQFRRQFLFDIATNYLNLVVQLQSIANAQRQVLRLQDVARRSQALVDSGRSPPFEAALAQQELLFAADRVNAQQELYRLAVDRFKVRLGMASKTPVVIEVALPNIVPPATTMDAAVASAMQYRLDLQNRRDQLDDARRGVDVARNALLPDLNLFGSLTLPTGPTPQRAGLRFSGEDVTAIGGVTFGLPLDREIERVALRQRQIDLERAQREYDQFRDEVTLGVRASLREIDSSQFSLQLQEENIRVNRMRQESIEAAPDRATARDRSDAIDRLNRAEDSRDVARRNLQVSILRYLLNTGQLRVTAQGTIKWLPGMVKNGVAGWVDGFGPPPHLPAHPPVTSAAPGLH